MELTVLGKSPSWQDAGGACSAYLVREGAYALLLDCGSGAFGKLRAVIDYVDIDAVLISHMHADHVLDLVPFANALRYSPRRGEQADAPPPSVFLPEGGLATLRRLGAVFAVEDLLESVFDVTEYAATAVLELGPLRARFCEVPHFIRAFAVEVSQPQGGRLTFGADCGPNDALARFAADADLLILEGTLLDAGNDVMFRGHMTPREAGQLARRARARRFVLSHFTDEVEPASIRSEATAGFGGEVELAREGSRFII